MTPQPYPADVDPTPEQVDNSNPEMRDTVARLAATLPPQIAAVDARVDVFAGLAADLVELAGGDRQAAAALVADAAPPAVEPPPLIDAYTESR